MYVAVIVSFCERADLCPRNESTSNVPQSACYYAFSHAANCVTGIITFAGRICCRFFGAIETRSGPFSTNLTSLLWIFLIDADNVSIPVQSTLEASQEHEVAGQNLIGFAATLFVTFICPSFTLAIPGTVVCHFAACAALQFAHLQLRQCLVAMVAFVATCAGRSTAQVFNFFETQTVATIDWSDCGCHFSIQHNMIISKVPR